MKKAKGVKKPTIKNEIKHKDFKDCYLHQKEYFHEQRRIGSKLHEVKTFLYTKKSLSFFDDKRYWLSKNSSVPFGHYSTMKDKNIKRKALCLPNYLEIPSKRSKYD